MPFTKWIAFKNLMARTCPVLLVLWVTLVLGLASAAVAGPAENLIDAATRGDMGAVQALLAKGADVNAKARDDWTALMLASQNGHLDVAQALLAMGAGVNAKRNDGTTALTSATAAGYTEVRTVLVKAGAK